MKRLFIVSAIICFNVLCAQSSDEIFLFDTFPSSFATESEYNNSFSVAGDWANSNSSVFIVEQIEAEDGLCFSGDGTGQPDDGQGGGSAGPIGDAIPFMLLLGAIYSFVCYRRNR